MSDSEGMHEPAKPLDLIDDGELLMLLDSIQVRPGGGATDDEMELIFRWANRVRMRNIFLGFLLDGSAAVVGFEGDEPRIAGMQHALDRNSVVAAAEQLLTGGTE